MLNLGFLCRNAFRYKKPGFLPRTPVPPKRAPHITLNTVISKRCSDQIQTTTNPMHDRNFGMFRGQRSAPLAIEHPLLLPHEGWCAPILRECHLTFRVDLTVFPKTARINFRGLVKALQKIIMVTLPCKFNV